MRIGSAIAPSRQSSRRTASQAPAAANEIGGHSPPYMNDVRRTTCRVDSVHHPSSDAIRLYDNREYNMRSQHTSGNRPSLIQVIISLLCIGVQSTPYMALASPFVFVDKVEASKGMISIDNMIDFPYTNSEFLLFHGTEGDISEGVDKYDGVYYPMFNPSGIASKVTSMVEGKELETDVRPENSTSPVTFAYTVIAEGGGAIPPINNPSFNVSTNGFADEDVFITVETSANTADDAQSANADTVTNLRLALVGSDYVIEVTTTSFYV